MSLSERLHAVLALEPQSCAIEYSRREYSWAYLGSIAAEIDKRLNGAGIPRGKAVGLLGRNRPWHIGAMLALFQTERCYVVINPLQPAAKLAEELQQLQLQAVIADQEDWRVPGLIEAARAAGSFGLALCANAETPVSTVRELSTAGAGPHMQPLPGVAVQMLTSGTTGVPKRITISTSMLDKGVADGNRSASKDQLVMKRSPTLVFAPIVNTSGVYSVMLAMLSPRPVVLFEKFRVDDWVDAVRRHRPKVLSLLPTMITMVLDANVPKELFEGVVAVQTSTAPLSPQAQQAFEERYGVPILIDYGATEFNGSVAALTLEDRKQFGNSKLGSVGRARPNCELRIVDPDTRKELAPGEVGELEVRSTRFSNGEWIRTNDLGSIDADGFLFLHGRADQAIIRGGFKVLPQKVIDVLKEHPLVLDAAVIARPDSRLGQVPIAAVEAYPGKQKPTVAELERYAREHLLPYQVPVEIRIVDELPRTVSMKVSLPGVKALFGV